MGANVNKDMITNSSIDENKLKNHIVHNIIIKNQIYKLDEKLPPVTLENCRKWTTTKISFCVYNGTTWLCYEKGQKECILV